jgi:serine O-acetyltransferase
MIAPGRGKHREEKLRETRESHECTRMDTNKKREQSEFIRVHSCAFVASSSFTMTTTTPPIPAPAAPADTARPPGLFAQIAEDWVAHGRDWTRPGFRAVASARFGAWRMTVRFKPFRAPLSILYRWMYRKCRNHYGIELPYTVKLGRRVVIEHQGAIVIHGHSEIGDDSIIRQGVTLGNKTLDRPHDAPKLGRNVNVGAGAKILGAVTIGDGATVGANAVVVKDVPAGAIAVGIPAQIILGKKG